MEPPLPDSCPRCGSKQFVHIVYGLLSEEGVARVKAGEFMCGGCSLHPDGPYWYCRVCHYPWPIPAGEESLWETTRYDE